MTATTSQPTLPDTAQKVAELTPEYIRYRCEAGIEACRRGDWHAGVNILFPIVAGAWLGDDVPSLAYGYLGYGHAAVGHGYKEGLRLCRIGVRRDGFEPENYVNLARTCLLRNRRQLAVKTLNRGLRISPGHRGLLELRRNLGIRRRPLLPFLNRTHSLNRFLGRLHYELKR